jgi:uncharacterized protein YuzB (UPF0349 family)|tara:strand:- start:58 stop:387 length:330 start_codon:yes stop_codon:yes gene_type:complete
MICDKCNGNGFTLVKGETVQCKKCLSSGEIKETMTPPKYTEEDLSNIYQTLYETSLKLSESSDPGMVAASLMAIGSRIYKTILTADDYDRIMDRILNTDVEPFKKVTLQ